MTKKERIKKAINFEKPDKLPYAIWTHLPLIDLDPQKLAEHTCDFYYQYNTDLVKTMDNGMYACEDYGLKVDYSDITSGGVAKVISTPIASYHDWEKFPVLNLSDATSLQRELKSLKLLVSKLKTEEVPIVFTVFSPLTTADKLSNKQVIAQIEEGHGNEVKRALELITKLTYSLVEEAINIGADGIFFASQLSSYDFTDEKTYLEYGRPYDMAVIQASKGWCNILHAHGKNIMFDILKDYPVNIFNWHAFESSPSIEEAKKANKCLMGGLVRNDITTGNEKAINKEIEECLKSYKGVGHILSPGCVIRYPIKRDNLMSICRIKDELSKPFFD